ncbi:MAG: serine/threonine-protein kinase [Thermoleophilaceae bacterium]
MDAGSDLIDGRYRVVRRLGFGGMATVFLADDERLHRPVALKRMHPAIGSGVAERFDREAKLGASMDHPCFVKVYDVLADDEQVTIVMEYVEGETLEEILRQGSLEPVRALATLRALADALDHAHRLGVIHRDVKPSNVLVRRDGAVKLADLGIATSADTTRITTSGTQLGSVAYMAPEQLEGKEASTATDVWGLGTVAFEVLGGRRARTATSPMGVVHQVANEPAPDLREVRPGTPPEAAEVLKQAMALPPEERPGSAGELVDTLEHAFASALQEEEPTREAEPEPDKGLKTRTPLRVPSPSPGSTRSTPQPHRTRRTRRVPAVAALALAAAAIAGVVVLATSLDEPAPAPESTPRTPAAEAPAPTPRRESPVQVVRDFYERAAADDYEGAYRLAGPGARSQLGTFDSFRGTFGTLQSVEFQEASVQERTADRATVNIATTALHTDRTDNCRGSVELNGREGRDWRIARLNIDCG